jgi:flagellar FliJ protein
MAFKFRLQGYLNIKEKLEEQKKNEYGQAMTALERERRIKQEITKERDGVTGEFRSAAAKKINPRLFLGYGRYIGVLRKRGERQETLIAAAEKTADEKRGELITRMRERKAIETVKERDQAVYVRDEKRAEQKLTDELVSYRQSKR